MNELNRLKDKVIIITGAGRGIGYTTAQLFSQEGAKLVLNDIDRKRGEIAKEEIKEKGDVIFVHGDVAEWSTWTSIQVEAIETYGKIDVLFNNAGMSSFKSLETTL
ncbi:SDR family NAD(P)-dependent oxidoreductase [Candidatus Bathyarchaeota archaeon]|nr:SDR family NAD(P)-dependent oxidoreductase [Candidatus Bathyarchaeota archaeon]